jgi:hypothetical protein
MNHAIAPLLSDLKAQANYYQTPGEELRERAASITSAAARSKFLQIADTYDRLGLAKEMASKPYGGA